MGTWNVQGFNRKINEVIAELKWLKMDLTVITETKRKGQGSESLGEYDCFDNGVPKDTRAKTGVSIIIHRKWRKYIKSWEAVNERIIKVNLDIFGHKITILGIYGINENGSVSEKNVFFQELNDQIMKIGRSRELIVLGDLNSRIGRKLNE